MISMELTASLRKLRPYFLMVMLQFGFAGIHIISVATLKDGMSHFVLVVYRNATATLVMAPFSLWFERKTRPKMSIVIFLKIMAMALMEIVLDQNLYYIGAKLTSASFASALIKIPAIPFVMALALRIEKVDIRKRQDQAKILGNVVTVAGAVVMIFYGGPIIEFIWSKGRSHHEVTTLGHATDWLRGAIMLLASAVFFSGFIYLQSNTLKSYPANFSLTTLICFIGTIMSTIVALVAERGNGKAWSIGWDTRLFAAAYSGILCTGLAYYVQGVVMKERDAVFVTAFNPLCMVIVVFLGYIILAEQITLGRMLGVIIIVIGLYFFIWGKSKDHDAPSSDCFVKEGLKLPKTNNVDCNSAIEDFVEIPTKDVVIVELPAMKKIDGNCASTSITAIVEIPEIRNS